jgi:UrcA family protein
MGARVFSQWAGQLEIQMSRTALMVCAALVFAVAATPSFAQYRSATPETERVYIGDLDLYQPKDAEELLARIDAAAYRVCSDESRPQNALERRVSARCGAETTNFTVAQLDHPMVSAIYRGDSPEVIIEEGSADPYTYGPYLDVEKK